MNRFPRAFRRRLGRVAVRAIAMGAPFAFALNLSPRPQPEARLIEVVADHDSRFRIPGQSKPLITMKAGEEVRLRITAIKAKNRNRDGSIHGFSLLRAKDRQPVQGWEFLLKPGTQKFLLTAPAEAGEYEAVCTVICSEDHEQMSLRVVVAP